ncbi:AraC family transcriptional regulator [Rhizobium sp. YK2]|uniref:AraC family transcriptional regulator n=1 Tax=Rhizobium sp. YK2 TaxID=1860096 RepID=UPI00084CAD21|nr:AraC family transcriptional regulator [Rhizobium sp. YK2]OED00832.1 AraC family transcriptional regulator [Rhizobium sp. YK2]
MTQTSKCKIPQAFWRATEQFGISPAVLLRQARLPATLHLSGQAFVTTAQYFTLMQALADLSNDPALGIRMVQTIDTAVHPPSSLAAFYARDYRDGLTRFARFKRLCAPEQLHIVDTGGECTISAEWPFANSAEPALSVDITFATLVELGRRGTGRLIVPRRVDLARAEPATTTHMEYFKCPIRTGMPQNLLVLDAADLDRPFPGHNPAMLDMLTPALTAALGELQAQDSVAEQVKIVLKRSLASGQPGLSDVAKQLGMSDRTLQRRITEESSTFRELLSDARRDLGRHLLTDPTIDIEEIACLLGYQDTTSFYRAFREWEGMPPNRWREMKGSAPAEGGVTF